MNSIKIFGIAVIVALISPSTIVTAEPADIDAGNTLERTELIETVLATNPDINSAWSSIRAMKSRVEVAGALDDPRLSVAIAPLTLDDSSIGTSIELSQEIPWPGRLDARQNLARAGVAMETSDLEKIRVELGRRASQLYDRWYVLHRALELNAHHRTLVEQMKSSAESQYVVGNASQQDPLQAEVRITRLLKEKVELDSEVRIVRAAMNALMHRPPQSEIAPPVQAVNTPEPITVSSPPADQPALTRAQASVRMAEAELRLAELETRPDLMAMGQFTSMFMNNDHRLMAGVGLRLPVRRSRIEASIRAARAELESRIATLRSVEDQVSYELQEAIYELDSHLATLTLYENLLIPASRDQTEAAQAGFSTGRNSFLAVLDAENNLQEVLLGYHTLLGEAWSAAADVNAALGRVPFIEMEMTHE